MCTTADTEGGPFRLMDSYTVALTRLQSIFTTGVDMLGVHMDTVPLLCPQQMTPFHGLCVMASQLPSLVKCFATMCPVLVSCQG